MRFMGSVYDRPRGGLNGWGDDAFCSVDRGIRFVGTGPFLKAPLRRHFTFRRLYSDGRLAARFELGVALVPTGDSTMQDSIGTFLSTPLSIADALGNRAASTVAAAGGSLRTLYHRATTKKKAVLDKDVSWQVAAGQPVLYLERLAQENIGFPFPGRQGPPLRDQFGLAIEYRNLLLGKQRFSTWVATLQPGFDRTVARHLRLSILRLQTEYACLGFLFQAVTDKRIDGSSQTMTDCVLESFAHVSRSESTARKLAGKDRELADLALAVSDAILPGRRDAILDALQKADPKLRDRIEALYGRKGDIVNNFNMEGAQGVQINQNTQGPVTQTNVIDNLDLTTLGDQLAELQKAVAAQPDDTNKAQAQKDIAAAKQAASEGNRSKVLEALKSSGQWLLGVAKEIGVPVAIAAIKIAIGVAAAA